VQKINDVYMLVIYTSKSWPVHWYT